MKTERSNKVYFRAVFVACVNSAKIESSRRSVDPQLQRRKKIIQFLIVEQCTKSVKTRLSFVLFRKKKRIVRNRFLGEGIDSFCQIVKNSKKNRFHDSKESYKPYI